MACLKSLSSVPGVGEPGLYAEGAAAGADAGLAGQEPWRNPSRGFPSGLLLLVDGLL